MESEKVRKSMEEIGRAIMECLANEPKTIKQLSEEVGSNWRTTLKYLEFIEWIQKCPKISRIRITEQIESWRREWGRIPS